MLCNSCRLMFRNFHDGNKVNVAAEGKSGASTPTFDPWTNWENSTCSMCFVIARNALYRLRKPDSMLQAPPLLAREVYFEGERFLIRKSRSDRVAQLYELFEHPVTQELSDDTSIPQFELHKDITTVSAPPGESLPSPVGVLQSPRNIIDWNGISNWFNTCHLTHQRCGSREGRKLPTRVIDIGAVASTKSDAYLYVTNREPGDYLTLSHRWNQAAKDYKTTKSNFNERLQALPASEMPWSFQDAISVTRKLGFRYLWIDSICIIQDDEKDWGQECQRMCEVYENSVLTISAMGADKDVGGFLKRDEPEQVLFRTPSGRVIGARRLRASFEMADYASELSKRGWVLQERILSPAILYFGQSEAFWECCSHTASEHQPELIPHHAGQAKQLLKLSRQFWPADALQDHFSLWYQLVECFSRMELTLHTDRLPAIMGLAKSFEKVFHAKFVSGLWLEDIHRGILWLNRRPRAEETSNNDSASPSWSWAPVLEVRFQGYYSPRLAEPDHFDFFLCSSRSPSISDLEIVDFGGTSPLPTSNPLSRGHLDVQGVLLPGRYSHHSSDEDPGTFRRREDSQHGLHYYADSREDSGDCYCLIVADFRGKWELNGRFYSETPPPVQRFYLIVKRVKRPAKNAHPSYMGHFRRIGVGRADLSVVEKVFGGYQKRRYLRLV